MQFEIGMIFFVLVIFFRIIISKYIKLPFSYNKHFSAVIFVNLLLLNNFLYIYIYSYLYFKLGAREKKIIILL